MDTSKIIAMAEALAEWNTCERPYTAELDTWVRALPTFELSHKTTFAPTAFGVDGNRHSSGTDATLIIYGHATFRDVVDKSASIHVSARSGSVFTYMRSSYWNGRAYVGLPDGVRKRICGAVEAALLEEFGPIEWARLAEEYELRNFDHEVEGYYSAAYSALANACRKIGAIVEGVS